ncbi:MAG: sulfotransferase [Devosia sp.]
MTETIPELDQAWTLLTQGRYREAAKRAQIVLDRYPGNASALVCRAMARWSAGDDIDASIADVRRVVAAYPAVAAIRHNLATLLASRGDIDDAAAEFREALRLKPDDTVAFYGLTQNSRAGADTELVAAMVALWDANGLDQNRREHLGFGLAKVFEELGEPERAMMYAMEANRLGARPWDAPGEVRALDELRELARLDAFRRARDSGHPSRAPLFIVGMPRSGTTLVEAILARHPQVLALGESMQLPSAEFDAYQRRAKIDRNIGRHELLLSLDRDWLAARAETMAKNWAARGSFRVVTDKLPENAVRLGLVKRLFPGARVVHVRRHPLDTGISNFFQRFEGGQGFSNRLDWLGARTRQVADSMAIWKTALDLPILDLHYEALVADPDGEARRLVAFAGLEWTDACLAPEAGQRSVRTASQFQVRQPINARSVARWKRYEPWLGPMIEAMGGMDWVEAEAGGG